MRRGRRGVGGNTGLREKAVRLAAHLIQDAAAGDGHGGKPSSSPGPLNDGLGPDRGAAYHRVLRRGIVEAP